MNTLENINLNREKLGLQGYTKYHRLSSEKNDMSRAIKLHYIAHASTCYPNGE